MIFFLYHFRVHQFWGHKRYRCYVRKANAFGEGLNGCILRVYRNWGPFGGSLRRCGGLKRLSDTSGLTKLGVHASIPSPYIYLS